MLSSWPSRSSITYRRRAPASSSVVRSSAVLQRSVPTNLHRMLRDATAETGRIVAAPTPAAETAASKRDDDNDDDDADACISPAEIRKHQSALDRDHSSTRLVKSAFHAFSCLVLQPFG